MKITLYRCADDERKLEKTLADGLEIEGTLKAGADILAPSVLFKGSVETLLERNYAYIPSLGRYYFLRDAFVVANGLCDLSFEVDVLQTYAEKILACGGRVVKSQTPEQYKLDKVLLDTNTTKHIDFENPFNFDGVNVMVCVNGARAKGA